MTKQIITRLVAVFVAAAIPNALIGQAIDVSVVQAMTLAGGMSVLAVVKKLAADYRDTGKTEQDQSGFARSLIITFPPWKSNLILKFSNQLLKKKPVTTKVCVSIVKTGKTVNYPDKMAVSGTAKNIYNQHSRFVLKEFR